MALPALAQAQAAWHVVTSAGWYAPVCPVVLLNSAHTAAHASLLASVVHVPSQGCLWRENKG